MLLIMENIKLALSSIRANKMRSFLTMLGIIIGISSVITIASLGETSKAVIAKEFEAFGKNRVVIYMPYSEEIRDSDYFTMEDIDKVKEKYKEDIVYLAPSTYENTEAISGRKKAKVSTQGVANGYEKMVNMDLIKGRFITEADIKSRRYVSVVDKAMADKIFPGENAVGKTIRISVEGQPADAKIVGVYEKKKSIFDGMMSSDSTTMYMPYSIFSSQLMYMGNIDMKIIESKSSIEVGGSIANFLSKMKKRVWNYFCSKLFNFYGRKSSHCHQSEQSRGQAKSAPAVNLRHLLFSLLPHFLQGRYGQGKQCLLVKIPRHPHQCSLSRGNL